MNIDKTPGKLTQGTACVGLSVRNPSTADLQRCLIVVPYHCESEGQGDCFAVENGQIGHMLICRGTRDSYDFSQSGLK